MSRSEHFAAGAGISPDEVTEHNNGFVGRHGDSPDVHEQVAEHLGVSPSEVTYTLEHHPMSSFPDRGPSNFDTGPEQDYIQGMAQHVRSLPPAVAAEGAARGPEGRREPVRVVDGHHRLAAHAVAGSKTVPIYVGRARRAR